MSERWSIVGFGCGLVAATLGVVAGVVDASPWGFAAAVAALAGALACLRLGLVVRSSDQLAARLGNQIGVLESAVNDAASTMGIGTRPSAVVVNETEGDPSGGAHQPLPGAYGNGSLIDPVTGLFTEDYFRVAIDARIAAARRHLRPVAVVVLEVVEGLPHGTAQPTDPEPVANSIRNTLREADTACRMSEDRFALLLEDTPENGAIWTVERLRRRLADDYPGKTLRAGVACYPAHAFDSGEILAAAHVALESAQEWRQDRIEVAETE